MSETKNSREFQILYERLNESNVADTVRTVHAMNRELDATAEVARLVRDASPAFTTYSTG